MPDLSESAVQQFWEIRSPVLHRIFYAMENVENWTLDSNPLVMEALVNLGDKLDIAESMGVLPRESLVDMGEEILGVLAYIRSGRAMRLLGWMDATIPGYAATLTELAKKLGEQDFARLLFDRLQAVERLQLLKEIFDPKSIGVVVNVLEGIRDDE